MSLRLYWKAVATQLPVNQRHLLEIIGALACDDCGFLWAGMSVLAQANQTSPRTVERTIRSFVELGLVKIISPPGAGRGHMNQYVALPEMARNPEAPCDSCRRRQRPGRSAVVDYDRASPVDQMVSHLASPSRNGMTAAERASRLDLLKAQAAALIAAEKEKTPT